MGASLPPLLYYPPTFALIARIFDGVIASASFDKPSG